MSYYIEYTITITIFSLVIVERFFALSSVYNQNYCSEYKIIVTHMKTYENNKIKRIQM